MSGNNETLAVSSYEKSLSCITVYVKRFTGIEGMLLALTTKLDKIETEEIT